MLFEGLYDYLFTIKLNPWTRNQFVDHLRLNAPQASTAIKVFYCRKRKFSLSLTPYQPQSSLRHWKLFSTQKKLTATEPKPFVSGFWARTRLPSEARIYIFLSTTPGLAVLPSPNHRLSPQWILIFNGSGRRVKTLRRESAHKPLHTNSLMDTFLRVSVRLPLHTLQIFKQIEGMKIDQQQARTQ